MHILEYLTYSTSPENQGADIFEMMNKSIQLTQIMGSIFRQNNMESTCCSLVMKIGYGEDSLINNFAIDSYILDFTLPFSENGRSFSILHCLVSCANNDIKKKVDLTESEASLSFFQKYLRKFDGKTKEAFKLNDFEIWTRFHSLLQFFKFERFEIAEILKLFTFILHCNDLPISKKKASFDKEEYFLNKSGFLKKIIRNLGIETDEAFFENFGVYNSLEEIKTAIVKMMKFTYYIIFEFVKSKIKTHIKNFFSSKYSSNKIKKPSKMNNKILTLIDIPGQVDDQTLGGLLINLVNESQFVLASSTYLSVVEKLEDDQLNVKNFKKLHCSDVLDAILGNQGLFTFLSKKFPEYFFDLPRNEKTKKIFDFSEHEIDDKEIKSRDYAFNIKFSHKQVVYNYQALHNEVLSLMMGKKLNNLFNNSTNSIIRFAIDNVPSLFEEKLSFIKIIQENLSNIFKDIEGISPYLIYSLHSKNSLKTFYKDSFKDKQLQNNYGENSSWVIPIKNTINICKNSLIIPVLFWEWFGYHEWIEVKQFITEFSEDFEKVKTLLKGHKARKQHGHGDISFKNLLPHEIINYMLSILIVKKQYLLGNSLILMINIYFKLRCETCHI